MAIETRRTDKTQQLAALSGHDGALDLARRLPGLVVAAKDIAASVQFGVHGRRRAGVGETFWQFRPFVSGESAQRIDWRRSARDDRLYVREREWEAAHTVWLWSDLSPSMAFESSLAMQPKMDRALLLSLALADLLVRGGERVGLMGLTRAMATRDIVERFAQSLLHDWEVTHDMPDLPPRQDLGPRTRAVLISDFLVDPDALNARLSALSARGATGCLLMIADPVEETFPFAGNTEFLDSDSSATFRAGRAEAYRADYAQRLARHRDRIASVARSRGFTLALHRTDRPASEALLALRARLEPSDHMGAA